MQEAFTHLCIYQPGNTYQAIQTLPSKIAWKIMYLVEKIPNIYLNQMNVEPGIQILLHGVLKCLRNYFAYTEL